VEAATKSGFLCKVEKADTEEMATVLTVLVETLKMANCWAVAVAEVAAARMRILNTGLSREHQGKAENMEAGTVANLVRMVESTSSVSPEPV